MPSNYLSRSESLKRLGLALGFIGLLAVANLAGFGLLYNTEDCLPRGWYVMAPRLSLNRGDTVLLCPPTDNPSIRFAIERHWIQQAERSVCSSGLIPYIKRVYALPGDVVSIEPSGVTVNGQLIPKTASLPTTLDGRTPMPHALTGTVTVPEGKVLLLATDSTSAFDGRYFGLVSQSDVVRRAWLLQARQH
jgi:conjugative transfer signal peptidase TraF